MSNVEVRLAVIAACVALSVFVAPPATAIPPANTIQRVITAAGSNTSQDVMSAILAQQNGNFTAGGNPGTSTQRDKFVNLTSMPVEPGQRVPGDATCGLRIYTPRGNVDEDPATVAPIYDSYHGRLALSDSAGSSSSLTRGCIDIARSVLGPSIEDRLGTQYFAYARDAVSWAAFPGGQAPSNLSRQNLIDIYSCTITDWGDGRLPVDAGSGQIIRILSVASQNDVTDQGFFGRIVLQGGPIPANSSSCPLVTLRDDEISGIDVIQNVPSSGWGRVIAPYSVAQWIAQGNGTLVDGRSGMYIGNINGLDPVLEGPLRPNAEVINNGSFVGARLVYNVLNDRSPAYADALRAVGFDANGPSLLCSGTRASTLLQYGFVPLPTINGNACL